MKEYTSNESILLTVGTQWKVFDEIFTCVERDDQKGWESYIIKIESPTHPDSPKFLRVTGKNEVKAFSFHQTYNNFKGIL